MSARPTRLVGRRETTALAVVAFWSALGLLDSTRAFVSWRVRGTPHTWLSVLTQNLPWWCLWALFTPVVFWLASRIRVDVPPRARAMAAHLASALAVAAAHLGGVALVNALLARRALLVPVAARSRVGQTVDAFLVVDLVTYGAVVAGWYALEYYRRLQEREVTTLELEAGIVEARMEALRRELNPHVLSNSLNAVTALVRRGENRKAVRALSELGGLLRITCDRELPQQVPLRREVEILRRYLAIEECRFGDRLNVAVELEEGTEDALVPALSLQPLVENAVRYGIAGRGAPGTVTIRASLHGTRLRLEVADSGPGPRPEVVRGKEEGVGLSNVRARLKHLYGSRGALTLGHRLGGGGMVTLDLPFVGGGRFDAPPVPEGAGVA